MTVNKDCEKCGKKIIDYNDWYTFIENGARIKTCKKCYDERNNS